MNVAVDILETWDPSALQTRTQSPNWIQNNATGGGG